LPQATSLATEISKKLGLKAELIRGDNGVFDVVADDTLIYSKDREGRFPDPEKIIAALQKAK